jgi:GT2 family glycosyltransferase
MKISVVIITLNRAKCLQETLISLKEQSYKNYETILVNGPSIDNTEEIVKDFHVRYFHTEKANICVSRNIGIKNSKGDLICFIDDDAIPEKKWLENISRYYSNHRDDKIGAMGGVVFNEEGTELQFRNGFIGIWGEVNTMGKSDQPYNDPKGYYFNTVIGVNCAFPKDALLKIRGFDEEIEYQHDESDVCVRLIKAGYKVVGVPDSIVYHKFAPSAIRDDNKIFKSWNIIAKNSIYFAIKNSGDYAPFILRLFKPLTLQLDKFQKIKEQKLGTLSSIKKSLSLIYWMLKGYFRGWFGKRKLIKQSFK